MSPTPSDRDPLSIVDALPGGTTYHSLPALGRRLGSNLSAMPYSLRILLESDPDVRQAFVAAQIEGPERH